MDYDIIFKVLKKNHFFVFFYFIIRGTELNLVYIIFDEYIKKNKKEFIFYLAVALIYMNQQVFFY